MKNILRLVAAGVVIGGAAVAAPNTLQLIDYFDPKGKYERNRIWKAIKYLESKHRIILQEHDGALYVELTTTGQREHSGTFIEDIEVKTPKYWDHKWRFVMFDLPVRFGKTRHVFRHKLQDLGFRSYQRSVFIYPYECHEEVHTIAKWYGVDQYIRYIVATEVHDMRRFAKEFDLL